MDNFVKIEEFVGRRLYFDFILRKKLLFEFILRKSYRLKLEFLEFFELYDKLKIFVVIYRFVKLRVFF